LGDSFTKNNIQTHISGWLYFQKMCHVDFNTNEIFNYLFLKLGEDRVLNIKMQIKLDILSYSDILILKKFMWVN
jgi:hypothetical protein